jgi:UDP-N-acetylglucosamine acyltransferase
MPTIDPQAIVSPHARLGRNVTIGPFCRIEADVELGDGCTLASHVVIKDGATLGANNRVFEGCILGGIPQHIRAPERIGRLVIGSNNTIRENCTLHRALHEGTATVIGDNNLLMIGAHVAHDCRVGSHTVFANNALLAGHVVVEDRAYISGAVGIHQFCRIGRLAMVGGHARVVQDVPPYLMVDGASGCIVGLNLVGLRRNGHTAEEIAQLKAAYRVIYRRGLKWNAVLEQLKLEFPSGPATHFHEFLSQGTRGFVQERRLPPGATLKLRRADDDNGQLQVKAG